MRRAPKTALRALALLLALMTLLPLAAASSFAAEDYSVRTPKDFGGTAEPGTRDGKELLSASVYGSGFEYWDSGHKFQLCLTISREDVNMSTGVGYPYPETYRFTSVLSYRAADTTDDWTYIITNPWSVYPTADGAIYRYNVMDCGLNNLAAGQEYEFNLQVYRGNNPVGWAQFWITYSADNEAKVQQYLDYLAGEGKSLITYEYGDFRTAQILDTGASPAFPFEATESFHKAGKEYRFDGWDKPFSDVVESTTYAATGEELGEWVAHLPGDANDDRTTGIGDATALLGYLAGEETSISRYTADTNGDCVITTKDLARLLAHLEDDSVPLVVHDTTSYSPDSNIDEWKTYGVKGGMTEEELGVRPTGQYKISFKDGGVEKVVGFREEDGTLVAGSGEGINNVFGILYQVAHGDYPYYIISPGDEIMNVLSNEKGKASGRYEVSSVTLHEGDNIVVLDRFQIDNPEWGSSWSTEDKYHYIQWYIADNDDGSVSFFIMANESVEKGQDDVRNYLRKPSKFCLAYSDGKFILQESTESVTPTGITHFQLEMTRRGSDQCLQYISDKGHIALRLPKTAATRGRLTDARGQQWANDVELAYEAFIELTSYTPYDDIIVKAFAPSSYMAYILGGSSPQFGRTYNTITVGTSGQPNAKNSWFVTDIRCLVLRGWGEHRDVNFGVLHEMGHMFDDSRGWKFETEMQTDMKLVYVLDKYGFCAVPSGAAPTTVYTGENILEDCYFAAGRTLRDMPTDQFTDDNYNIIEASGVFIRIKNEITWEPFKKAFAWYQANVGSSEVPSRNGDRFEFFVQKLDEYSEKDVRSLFEGNEYENLLKRYT